MRLSILLFSITLLSLNTLSSQITVDHYERQPKVNIDELDQFAPVTAKSSCGEVQVEVSEQMFSGGCLGNLVRTYVFTDTCGNKERAEQYIVLQDKVAPTFLNAPKDVLAYANAIPELEEIKAVDNSDGEIKIDFTEKIGEGQIVRNWVATDQCGNQHSHTQLITIQDTQASTAN